MRTIILLLGCVTVWGWEIVEPPQDVIANPGEDETINCTLDTADQSENGISVAWYEFVSLPSGRRIFSSDSPSQIARPAKYNILGTYNLKISAVTPGDAGKYECRIDDGDKRYPAMMTVFETPSCSYFDPDKLTEGREVSYECQVAYNGAVMPMLKWYKDNMVIPSDLQIRENHPVVAKMKFTVSREDSGKTLSCRVTSSNSSIRYNGNQCSIRPLDVKYKPRDLKVLPYDTTKPKAFNVGDTLYATVDAHPVAGVKWVGNVANESKTLYGQELEITPNMVGTNHWVLTVRNTMNMPDDELRKVLDFVVKDPGTEPQTTTDTKQERASVKPVGAMVAIVTSLVTIVTLVIFFFKCIM